MIRWYGPSGQRIEAERGAFAVTGAEHVGARSLALLLRARSSRSGTLVLQHSRAGNAERLAAARLVERGLLTAPNFLGAPAPVRHWRTGARRAAPGLYRYNLTERGRSAWLWSRA